MTDRIRDAQSLSEMKGELTRPFFGEQMLTDAEVSSLHRDRAAATLADMTWLRSKGVTFSPFLEIGAGAVQRSLALMHGDQCEGVATDISQNTLQNAPFVLSLLGYQRTPIVICCDACHLPFLTGTFRFVFCYQTLHHFEDPAPVIAECYRVLGKGGHFYFAEEPMDSPFRRVLRGKRVLSRPSTRLQRLGFRLGVERIFWDDGALERSLGIHEGNFDITIWRSVLRHFLLVEAEVTRRLRIKTDLRSITLGYLLAAVTGGQVRGLCRKNEGQEPADGFQDRLICLDCGSTRIQIDSERLDCQACGRVYPITEGVIRMLPSHLETQLYTN